MVIQYQPLEPGQIRLLRLNIEQTLRLTDNYGWVPSATLETVAFSDAPKYHAISYMWGDASTQRPILLNGSRVLVTTNLRQALKDIVLNMQAVRDDTYERAMIEEFPVWADAICINQADTDERACQVSQMDQVYTKASSVLICAAQSLGAAESHAIFRLLQYCADLHHHKIVDKLVEEYGADAQLWSAEVVAQFRGILQDFANLSSNNLAALEHFTTRQGSWWERAWIVQEISLAVQWRAVLVSGDRNLEWTSLSKACQWNWDQYNFFAGPVAYRRLLECHFADVQAAVLQVQKALTRLAGSVESLEPFRHHGSRTLAELLNFMSLEERQASMPHDMVYCLLAMASDKTSTGLVVDYDQPWQSFFQSVSSYYLRTIGSLALGQMSRESGCDSSSCIRNWKRRSAYNELQWTALRYGDERYFNASLNRPSWWYRIDGRHLHLRAYCVGAVKAIADVGHLGEEDIRWNPQKSCEWLSVFTKFVNTWINPTTAQEKQVWLAPIADLDAANGTDRLGPQGREDMKVGFEYLCHYREPGQPPAEALTYMESLHSIAGGGMWLPREIFVTETGYLGLGHRHVRKGDQILVIAGADVPMLVRKRSDGRYQIIQEAYVHGIMDGEFVAAGAVAEEVVIV